MSTLHKLTSRAWLISTSHCKETRHVAVADRSPSERLRQFVRNFVASESETTKQYEVCLVLVYMYMNINQLKACIKADLGAGRLLGAFCA
jgi:hypothetical protein